MKFRVYSYWDKPVFESSEHFPVEVQCKFILVKYDCWTPFCFYYSE